MITTERPRTYAQLLAENKSLQDRLNQAENNEAIRNGEVDVVVDRSNNKPPHSPRRFAEFLRTRRVRPAGNFERS